MPSLALDVEDLCVDYGAKRALHNISLQVGHGEILGLLGPNGSGKTTLLRSITGKLKPSAGELRVCGKTLRAGKAHRHAIAFAPQALGLYQHLTARENLEVFGRFLGLTARQSRDQAKQALADIELTEKADTLARHLSGGMQRRLHIAATFLARPQLLVLDEPTAGVDLAARASIHELLRKRAAQGAAVVLVTHELKEAEQLCNKLAILNGGELVQLAPPQQLISEVFGDARIFRLRTQRPPEPDMLEHLRQVGLRPQSSPSEWHMWAELSLNDFVAQLEHGPGHQLEAFAEVSMHRPNLNDVMRHITGADLTEGPHPKPDDASTESDVRLERERD